MVTFLENQLFFLSVFLSLVSSQSTPSFWTGDVSYIRPSNIQMTWSEAQRTCRENNSTLPIVDNPDNQKSFANALDHFSLNDQFVWLGGKASYGDPHDWYWLNGTKYSGTDAVQSQGSYDKSYAYVRNLTKVMAYADAANKPYYYICQFGDQAKCVNRTGQTAFTVENRCYVKYAEILSWFHARNNCLSNGGDLASFDNLSSLVSIIDFNAYWVGLTSSWWTWQNAVTNQSCNVSFTLWNPGQPDNDNPNCISTDTDNFPTWRDYSCDNPQFFICQIVDTIVCNETTIVHTNQLSATSISYISAPTVTSQTSSTTGKSVGKDSGGSKLTIPLAVGLGVGIPVVIAIIVVIIIIVLRRKRHSTVISWSKKKIMTNNRQQIPQKETELVNDDYATVRGDTVLQPETERTSPSKAVYADLRFDENN